MLNMFIVSMLRPIIIGGYVVIFVAALITFIINIKKKRPLKKYVLPCVGIGLPGAVMVDYFHQFLVFQNKTQSDLLMIVIVCIISFSFVPAVIVAIMGIKKQLLRNTLIGLFWISLTWIVFLDSVIFNGLRPLY